jgi:hypothetical protein
VIIGPEVHFVRRPVIGFHIAKAETRWHAKKEGLALLSTVCVLVEEL